SVRCTSQYHIIYVLYVITIPLLTLLHLIHVNGGVSQRRGTPSRSRERSRPDRDHVRGGSLVALPSCDDFRLPENARCRGHTHCRCKEERTASVHTCGAHPRRRAKLRERQRSFNLTRIGRG